MPAGIKAMTTTGTTVTGTTATGMTVTATMGTPPTATGIERAMTGSRHSKDDRGQVKLVSIVLVVTMSGWLVLQLIGGQYGWPAKYVFLFDLAALAGFAWALIVTYRIWRNRQN